tara:strand:+ start:808 stop:1635 length:828 start_codon:yes stop_codon:yes gene_type:complete
MKLCGFDVGLNFPFFLISGPCVIESEQMAIDTAGIIKEITSDLGIPYVFKSSFDKANRSTNYSFRGPGLEKGLNILAKVRKDIDIPVLTDVHESREIPIVAEIVDILQTPAFLCRQTDFIKSCAESGKPVNIKKGQFLAPNEMKNVIDKARQAAKNFGLVSDNFLACERGVSFGYNNLVSDMRSLVIMREIGCPIVFDASHSVQLPGALGSRSGGQSEFISVLAKAAVAVGISGLFIEVHPNPNKALSDGPNSLHIEALRALLEKLVEIDRIVKK